MKYQKRKVVTLELDEHEFFSIRRALNYSVDTNSSMDETTLELRDKFNEIDDETEYYDG